MKLPGTVGSAGLERIVEAWERAALDMSIKYGIFVESKKVMHSTHYYVTELLFEVEGHSFECLEELERALKQKAFL
jgi:SRSO17 transposase